MGNDRGGLDADVPPVTDSRAEQRARFKVGDVIRHQSDGARGVVIRAPVRDIVQENNSVIPGDMVVRLSVAVTRFTNAYEEWVHVPPEAHTIIERVRSVEVSYEPPDVNFGETMPEDGEFGFALMRALMSPQTEAEVFSDGASWWPTGYVELARAVANSITDPRDAAVIAATPEPYRTYALGMSMVEIPDGWSLKQRDYATACIIHDHDAPSWMEMGYQPGDSEGGWWWRAYLRSNAALRVKQSAASAVDAFEAGCDALANERPTP